MNIFKMTAVLIVTTLVLTGCGNYEETIIRNSNNVVHACEDKKGQVIFGINSGIGHSSLQVACLLPEGEYPTIDEEGIIN